MKPPTDPRSLVGLLECEDGTAAVIGKPHNEAQQSVGLTKNHSSVLLTREAGEALYELLGDWLGKRQEGFGELTFEGMEPDEDTDDYCFDPKVLHKQIMGESPPPHPEATLGEKGG